jgi:hypothetical protein
MIKFISYVGAGLLLFFLGVSYERHVIRNKLIDESDIEKDDASECDIEIMSTMIKWLIKYGPQQLNYSLTNCAKHLGEKPKSRDNICK